MQRPTGSLTLLDKGEPLVSREAQNPFGLVQQHGLINERTNLPIGKGTINSDQHSGHLINRCGIAVQDIQNRQAKDLGKCWRDIGRNRVLPPLPLRNRGLITANLGSYLCLSKPLLLSSWTKMTMHGAQICA